MLASFPPSAMAVNHPLARKLVRQLKPQGLTKKADPQGLQKLEKQAVPVLEALESSARSNGPNPRALLEIDELDDETRVVVAQQMFGYSDPREFFVHKLAEGIATAGRIEVSVSAAAMAGARGDMSAARMRPCSPSDRRKYETR